MNCTALKLASHMSGFDSRQFSLGENGFPPNATASGRAMLAVSYNFVL